jgi:GDP/UDP-N,N'-diacetylbacillosamine 2-epimerase (hydrolysing)
MRKVMYVTGTRADFGLMASTLQQVQAHPDLALQVAVTGMHLSEVYGSTVRDIEALQLPIVARIPTNVEERSPGSMAQAIGQAVTGLAKAMADSRPDVLMVLGDRGEMLAGAIAAVHLGIPVAHLHGGERSGTVDEPVRHAITKLSHWHFVATGESRDRVIRLGERPEHVWITGAPGLDGLHEFAATTRADVLGDLGLPGDARYVLVLFHPVVQEMDSAELQTGILANALTDAFKASNTHVVWLDPNADAGSGGILRTLEGLRGERLHRITHLPRPRFVAALAQADALVGNSSAGIIEAASFGTPAVNIGSRQRSRERNANTTDCEVARHAIADAVAQAVSHGHFPPRNRYGDGCAGERITRLLATLPIESGLMDKVNTF